MVCSHKSDIPQTNSSISISEITISYLHKNIIIPLLCQCELFIHTYVSKKFSDVLGCDFLPPFI